MALAKGRDGLGMVDVRHWPQGGQIPPGLLNPSPSNFGNCTWQLSPISYGVFGCSPTNLTPGVRTFLDMTMVDKSRMMVVNYEE